jgi:hypothetical protein
MTFTKSVEIIADFLQEVQPNMLEWEANRNARALIARLAEKNLLIEEVTGDF